MTGEQPENVFQVLHESLVEFHEQVEGKPGSDVAAMGDATGVIPDLVRVVLAAVDEPLRWLYETLIALEEYLAIIDPALALVETLGEALKSISSENALGGLPGILGIDGGIFTTVDGFIQDSMNQVGALQGTLCYLPTAEDFNGIQAELEQLMPALADPNVVDKGSWGELLETIGAPG